MVQFARKMSAMAPLQEEEENEDDFHYANSDDPEEAILPDAEEVEEIALIAIDMSSPLGSYISEV